MFIETMNLESHMLTVCLKAPCRNERHKRSGGDQPHAQVALSPTNDQPSLAGNEAGWDLEPV
jgi:hypothetical protein